MKYDQKYSPKWWVGHHKKQEDVFMSTVNKSKSDTVQEMEFIFGEDWFIDEDLEVILVEIKMVNL